MFYEMEYQGILRGVSRFGEMVLRKSAAAAFTIRYHPFIIHSSMAMLNHAFLCPFPHLQFVCL